MNNAEAMAEVFWMAFQSLPRTSQNSFLQRLLKDQSIRDDLMDMAIIEIRRNETGRPLRDYFAERQKT